MRPVLVLAALVAAAAALPSGIITPVVAPLVATTQYHAQDEIGQYSYGYSNPLSAKSEVRAADGNTIGAYTYVDPDGKLQSVEYSANDALGFRVAASNLPVPPAVPVAPKLVAPVPVEDTPEVVEARSKHLDALKAAEARAKIELETVTSLRSAITTAPAAAVAVKSVPAVALAAVATPIVPTPLIATRTVEGVPTPADTVKTKIEPAVEVKTAEVRTSEAIPTPSEKAAEPTPEIAIKTEEKIPGALIRTSLTEVRSSIAQPAAVLAQPAAILAQPAIALAAPAIQSYSFGISPIFGGYISPVAYSTHFFATPGVIGEVSNSIGSDSVTVESRAKTEEVKEKSTA